MRDEDLVGRLPIAAILPAGVPVSKYFRNLDVEDFMRSSLEAISGNESIEDPVVALHQGDCALISKEELIAKRCELAAATEAANHEGEGYRDIVPNESADVDDADDAREIEDNFGHSAEGLPTPCQSHESEEERQVREQEERLAALGVTGFAKPVRTSVRRPMVLATPAPLDDPDTLINCDNVPRQGVPSVSSNSSHEAIFGSQHSNPLGGHRPNPFNDHGWEGYKRSASPPPNQYATSLQTPPASGCHDSFSDKIENPARRSSSDGVESTLTNPPAVAKCACSDPHGHSGPETTPNNRQGSNILSPGKTTGIGMAGDDGRSPSKDYMGQGCSRKRSFRELSAEIDEGPRRQKDEGHQRDKRKAPRVAAAYR
jgi:hypothetical protein